LDSDDDHVRTVELRFRQTWARFEGLSGRFFDIAEDAFAQFLRLKASPDWALEAEDDFDRYDALRDEFQRSILHTIVYCAMGCEAAIFDLAAIHLGDQFATKVLDKLDVIGKWLVVPRLICGTSLRDNGPAINALRSLVPARNRLVHAKSYPYPESESLESYFEDSQKRSKQLIAGCEASFQAVVLLSLELDRVFGTHVGVMPSYGSPFVEVVSIQRKRAPELKMFIDRCIEIDKKATASSA
jgi:hypothetical protein